MRAKSMFDNKTDVNGVSVITATMNDVKPDILRKMGDEIKANNADTIAVIAGVDGEKANFVVVAGKDAVAKGAHSGKIVGKVAALTGGKGGGRPDSAMAGVGDKNKIADALNAVNDIIAEFVK